MHDVSDGPRFENVSLFMHVLKYLPSVEGLSQYFKSVITLQRFPLIYMRNTRCVRDFIHFDKTQTNVVPGIRKGYY